MIRTRIVAFAGGALLTVVAIIPLTAPRPAEARYDSPTAKTGDHTDAAWGIAFAVPAVYEVIPTPPVPSGGGITASFRRQEQSVFAPRFNLVCAAIPERFPGDSPPPDAEDWMLQAHAGERDFHAAGRARFRVAGQEAVAIAFTEREPASCLTLRGRAVAVAHNRVLYVFSFAAVDGRFTEEAPLFEKVLQGVRWLTPAGEVPPAAKAALARAAEKRHFADPGFGLSFSVPDGYVRLRSTPPPAGTSPAFASVSYQRPEAPAGPNLPPPTRPQNTIVVQKIPLSASNEADVVPQEEIQAFWKVVEKQPAFERLPAEPVQIEGHSAQVLHFRYQNTAAKRMVQGRALFVARGRDLYNFILACDEEAFAAEAPHFQAMLEGVRFTPVSESGVQ